MITRNTCAQRIAARVLAERSGRAWQDHYAELLRTHPPDTPLRLLGTTPSALARMLRDGGIDARVVRRGTREDLAAGSLACIDLRALIGGLPRLHWVRIEHVGPEGIRAEGRLHSWVTWMRAWTCRASPFAMHRRALVVERSTKGFPPGALAGA